MLIEWSEAELRKYWLSTVPEGIALAALVDSTKLGWHIERDYQDLNQEAGSATTMALADAAPIIVRRSAPRNSL